MKNTRKKMRKPCRRRRGGFTLVEVLLVLVILVILVSLVVGTYTKAQKKARVNSARTQIGLFEQPIEMFYLDVNFYPSTQQGLDALNQQPGDLANPARWDGPYLKKRVPLDPWDMPYQYECPGKFNVNSFDIWSFGPDTSDGTDDDIGNWEMEAVR